VFSKSLIQVSAYLSTKEKHFAIFCSGILKYIVIVGIPSTDKNLKIPHIENIRFCSSI